MGFVEVIANGLILLGAVHMALCGAGMLFFRDVYARMSVLGTAAGFGVSFIVIGAFLLVPGWWNAVLGLAAVVLLLGTSAIGSTLIARAALLRGNRIVDERYNEAAVDPSGM
ncbi:MAG TPA: monovalent cation/H(+) antiporter subunit G [Corynebacterium sp.]|nr:monovalent cation/H(+) antiporter subunit G [Corynebacterium sp.]